MYANEAHLIENFSEYLHEPRWDAVYLFCLRSMRPIAALRRAWSSRLYSGNGQGILVERLVVDGTQFIPAQLIAVVRSSRLNI